MKKLTTQITVLLVLLGMVACDLNSNDNPLPPLTEPIKIQLNAIEKEILNAEKQNAMKIFAKVAEKEAVSDAAIPQKANFMISPFSLNMALTMAWNGANGETKEAIETALGFTPEYREALNAYYKKMGESFVKTDPRTDLLIANSFWYRAKATPKPNFENTLKKDYYAYTKGVDFADANTKDLMNDWCKKMTKGVIKKVIEETSGDDLMYLMNALYFKGIWADKFETSDTKQEDFTVASGSKIKVSMMHQNTEMGYQENDNFSAISLPYGNKAYSMVVLLPKEGNSVEQLAKTLAENGNISYFENAKVDLYLPKFKFKYNIKLNDILIQMGMGIAFTNDADFSNAFDIDNQISYVKQFTGIEVNEEGTEAAAVTVVGNLTTSAPTSPKEVSFNANRPFAFLIKENSTGGILFMGKVGNPNEE